MSSNAWTQNIFPLPHVLSSFNVLQFSVSNSYNSHPYVVCACWSCKWNTNQISFLGCSLLLYRNTTDLCILILYPKILLPHLLALILVCVPQNSLYTLSRYLQTRVTSLKIWMPSISFSLPNYPAQIFRTKLKRQTSLSFSSS